MLRSHDIPVALSMDTSVWWSGDSRNSGPGGTCRLLMTTYSSSDCRDSSYRLLVQV